MKLYDTVIVGGGPAGLSAALSLGIARKQVLLCDDSSPRNSAATQIHNFVTRDGTSPAEFRATAREQLTKYPSVEVTAMRVSSIQGTRGAFNITLQDQQITARRILLATGMIDEMLPIEGFRELWARSIFQCPYCHGWEVRERPWGYLASPEAGPLLTHFALLARGWTRDLVLFTDGKIVLSEADEKTLIAAGVRIETTPIARLHSQDNHLQSVELTNGTRIACEALFAHPPQRQGQLVRDLGLALDEHGYVQVDPMRRETSIAGIYAAGDLQTRQQGAIFAAAAGVQAAAMLNMELTTELALSGVI